MKLAARSRGSMRILQSRTSLTASKRRSMKTQQAAFVASVIPREIARTELPRRVPRGEASRKAGCRKSARPV